MDGNVPQKEGNKLHADDEDESESVVRVSRRTHRREHASCFNDGINLMRVRSKRPGPLNSVPVRLWPDAICNHELLCG